jgi:hypothetical protein
MNLFDKKLNVGKCALSPESGELPLLGPGFAMIVDYCLALSFFPTRSTYESFQNQHLENFAGLETIYSGSVQSHLHEGRRALWKGRWIDHMQDPETNMFVKKPVFPRIGVSGQRVTSQDLKNLNKPEIEDDYSYVSIAHIYIYIMQL